VRFWSFGTRPYVFRSNGARYNETLCLFSPQGLPFLNNYVVKDLMMFGNVQSGLPLQHQQLKVFTNFLFYFCTLFAHFFPSLTTGYKNCNAPYTMGKQFSQRNLQFFVFFFFIRFFIGKRDSNVDCLKFRREKGRGERGNPSKTFQCVCTYDKRDCIRLSQIKNTRYCFSLALTFRM